MKKFLLVIAALAVFAGQMLANPVDVNTAKNLGVKFMTNNVLSAKGITDAQHVYTLSNENDVPYLYVFNYDGGYVVMAADDRAYPVLGYCEDGVFDVNNIPDGLKYFLGHYGRQIQYAIDNELVADEEVAEQWKLLREEGVIMKTRMEKAVSPLLSTTWDQGWPYNYYAPACSSYWTNNHCYAGCVATAMSQVMKFWNWPETGVGEHSYSSSSYGGTLSANFGATTYNWSIMPNSVSSANTAGQAVALLMYHCGIAVDMNYSPDGSGAQTGDVPAALSEHFRYGACANMKARDSYAKSVWEDMLIETFDRGIPVVYAGNDTDGGHAFNCDGYNNNRYFHFNWGWSGSYNNYYQIDALNTGNGNFNNTQRCVFEIMPDYIYNAMVPEIETMTVDVDDAITKTAHISWTVPTESMSGEPLTTIQRIVLKRNGVAIQTYNNPQPGDVVTYDDNVTEYGAYEYSIVGVNNNFEGGVFSQRVIFGPSCSWKFVCQTTNFQGWNDAKLQVLSANGTMIDEITMTSSTPLSKKVRIPEGNFSLKWVAPATALSSVTITLKNSANQTEYTYTGASSGLNGTIFSGNNDCPSCTAPTNLTGENAGGMSIHLAWDCDYSPSKFRIYEKYMSGDYTMLAEIDGNSREYVRTGAEIGTYSYKVTAYSSACESDPAITPDSQDHVIIYLVLSTEENSVNAKIYPNPTTGNVRIEAQDINTVEVFNLVGQKVYEENVSGDECVINMKEFGSGIYMMKIETLTGSTTQKISVIE